MSSEQYSQFTPLLSIWLLHTLSSYFEPQWPLSVHTIEGQSTAEKKEIQLKMPENKNKLELFTELYVDSQNIKLPVSVVVGVLLRVPNEGQISVVVGGASVI